MTSQILPPLSFGALLKRTRRMAGLTQEELGAAAGYTAAYISALEHGERVPPLPTAEHLARALTLEQPEHDTFLRAAALALRTRRHALEADEGKLALPSGGFLGATPEGPLVARTPEIRLLDAALTDVVTGTGRVIMLAGEPGIGKTRLAQEVALQARARGALVATGRCYEPQRAVAFAPFIEALVIATEAAPATVRNEMPERWPEVLRLLPDTPQSGAGPHAAVSERDAQQRLFWQVTGFVREVAVTQPVALLLDDLHWADEASLNLLLHLARHTRGTRVLLLGTYRDVELSRRRALQAALRALKHERLVERVAVCALEAKEMAALVAVTLRAGEVTAELTELIQNVAEGNPFLAQEVLRTLHERGDLVRNATTGRWERRTGVEIGVPETVRDAIGERMARLRPATQKMLREASVLGQVFTFAALCQMRAETEAMERGYQREHLDTVEVEVEDALEEALRAGMLQDTSETRYACYAFSHALTQRAVYTAILAPRRRRLHRAAGTALVELSQREQGHQRPAAELARHFLEGDSAAQALPYVLAAGDQAEHLYAYAEAEQHYRLALELARELGNQAHEAEALEKLAEVFWGLGRAEEIPAALEAAAEIHRAAGNLDQLAWDTAHMSRPCILLGQPSAGLARLEELLVFLATLADSGGDRPAHLSKRYIPAEAGGSGIPLEICAERAAAVLSQRATARVYLSLTVYLSSLGRYHETVPIGERATTYAQAANEPWIEVRAQVFLAFTLISMGQWTKAVATLERARVAAEKARDLEGIYLACSNLGSLLFVRGAFAKGLHYMEQAKEAAEQHGMPDNLAQTLCGLAWMEVYTGRWDRANAYCERATATIRALDRVSESAWVALIEGVLHLLRGQAQQAHAYLEEVTALGESANGAEARLRACSALAEDDLLHGRAAAAKSRLEPLLASTGLHEWGAAELVPLLAWACLELGEQERAAALVAESLARTRELQQQLVQVDVLRIGAMLALRRGRWREAEEALEEALVLARSMPNLYAEAKTLYVYGLLEIAQDEPDQAHGRLEAALTILNQHGEQLYARQVERELSAVDSVLVDRELRISSPTDPRFRSEQVR
jgi:tetratricopeptide (TPR) repeat protein/transcriptional regulator with XRE-family HTH domain